MNNDLEYRKKHLEVMLSEDVQKKEQEEALRELRRAEKEEKREKQMKIIKLIIKAGILLIAYLLYSLHKQKNG